MKRALIAIALGCAVLAAPVASVAAAGPPAARAAASSGPASAGDAFALDLLHELAGDANLVYSPYSIEVALAMAGAGAAGQTATQMAQVLHASSSAAAVADAAALRRALRRAVGTGRGAPTLDVADGLWTQSGLALGQPFRAALTGAFGAPPRSTDFATAPAAALAAINSWVSKHTGALIHSLLPPGSVDTQTALVLANAVYLKALWATQFERSATSPGPFTTATGAVVRVPFMHQSGGDENYLYGAGPSYQAVFLPYMDSTLGMLAILPRGQTLASFDSGLNAQSLGSIIDSLSGSWDVNLALPRLDLSSREPLNPPLTRLGMTDAFGPSADFSGITAQRRLSLSLVEHAAVLKVNEHGTVAAAATAIVAPGAAVPVRRPSVTIDLNHPFLALVLDEASHTVLFVARVENPAER
ncbi:MAG TPA: serpin family protein [Solirubrobacteraceae bacterium]|nr:serpin family protein [Solirubrobacteraceae bacterium]